MLPAAFSMLLMDIPFTILLMIGTISVSVARMIVITTVRVNAARIQSGAFLPLILIFCRPPIIGFAISDTTTAANMYIRTFLKYQQMVQMMPIPAAARMYLASLSTYLSVCSISVVFVTKLYFYSESDSTMAEISAGLSARSHGSYAASSSLLLNPHVTPMVLTPAFAPVCISTSESPQ